ncbi:MULTISPECIES: polysaccharide deacetylase family protein [Clostridium]|uniref:polysaccharide deacetylase family protein n=1 Tax=Clostridium TaxID=1485 RepID=UPI00082640A9|nr:MULTISPECIES: polysaccharide deacetylase family protein [Clostridium]PJI07298.1 polysaccharide deacetylase [Clostridium sp. CT7]
MKKTRNSLILKRSIAILSIAVIILGLIYIVKVNFLSSSKKVQKNVPTKMAASNKVKNKKVQKVVYLTFDDGPSANVTLQILDTLKKYNINATFFVTGKNSIINKLTLIRESRDGNEIALKSFNNDTKKIYSSPEAYINDLNECSDILGTVLQNNKFNNKLIRFPGGSNVVNKKFTNSIKKAGYTFVDWNLDSKDSVINKQNSSSEIINHIKASYGNNDKLIILMHDSASNGSTSVALPEIIEFLKSQNYIFKTL